MYYDECTPAYAVGLIKEITEYAENAVQALELIRYFLDGEMSTDEIENLIF